MTIWEATVKFAPLLSVERVNDPKWKRADRHMVTPQTFRLPHKKESIPLLADHDENCELWHYSGVVPAPVG